MSNAEESNIGVEIKFPALYALLENPEAELLLDWVQELSMFTDHAIDLHDSLGRDRAVSGWQSLRDWAAEKGDMSLLCTCLHCESVVYMAIGDSCRFQAKLMRDTVEKLPKMTPPQGGTDPALELIESLNEEARTAWRKQRELLYKLSTLEVEHDPKFASAFLCNFGSCLSHVGRTAEAMHHWHMALCYDEQNMAALVAYGEGCLRLAKYFPRHSMLLLDEAYVCFMRAMITENDAMQFWGVEVFVAATTGLKQLSEIWSHQGIDGEIVTERIKNRMKAHEDFEPSKQIRIIGELGLFLTVSPNPLSCPSTAKDDAFPEAMGYRTLAEQERLANLLNTVKEDYSLGRFLLFQFVRESRPQVLYSALTHYITKPSQNEFGLRPGLIKSVVRTNIDALDRVAKVLEILLGLTPQNPNRPLSFNNIWYKNRDRSKGIRDEIREKIEFGGPLFGLYDIHLAWDVEDGPLKSLRDLFVHDVGELTGYAKYLKVKKPNSDTSEELDILNLAVESLRILRGAFIMLCQIANREYFGRGSDEAKEAIFHLGSSLSDRLDLGEELE